MTIEAWQPVSACRSKPLNSIGSLARSSVTLMPGNEEKMPTQAAMSRGTQVAARAGVRFPLPPKDDGERHN